MDKTQVIYLIIYLLATQCGLIICIMALTAQINKLNKRIKQSDENICHIYGILEGHMTFHLSCTGENK